MSFLRHSLNSFRFTIGLNTHIVTRLECFCYDGITFDAHPHSGWFICFAPSERNGLKVTKIFEARRENPTPSSPYPPFFIIFEEYQSSIESISKKADKEKVLGQVGNLLRLSRQVNCHLVCVCQRSDSNLFSAGGRENFSARLSIARLSPQAKQMLFPDDEVNCNKGQGEVNLQFDGQPVIEARTYTIRDMDKAERLITDLLSRGLPLTDEAVARSP